MRCLELIVSNILTLSMWRPLKVNTYLSQLAAERCAGTRLGVKNVLITETYTLGKMCTDTEIFIVYFIVFGLCKRYLFTIVDKYSYSTCLWEKQDRRGKTRHSGTFYTGTVQLPRVEMSQSNFWSCSMYPILPSLKHPLESSTWSYIRI